MKKNKIYCKNCEKIIRDIAYIEKGEIFHSIRCGKEYQKKHNKLTKKQILEIIKEESEKLEGKYCIPWISNWDDIFDDSDETGDISVELAYNCINRLMGKNGLH